METLGCGDNEANDGSVTLSTVSTRSNIQHYLSSSRHKVRGLGDADIDLIVWLIKTIVHESIDWGCVSISTHYLHITQLTIVDTVWSNIIYSSCLTTTVWFESWAFPVIILLLGKMVNSVVKILHTENKMFTKNKFQFRSWNQTKHIEFQVPRYSIVLCVYIAPHCGPINKT